MPTQAELLKEKLKDWYQKFGKTPIAIPVIIALSCLVFYASVAYLGTACLTNLIAPLFMLGMLWSVNVKSVKKLLIIGVIATFFFASILGLFLVTTFQHVTPKEAVSEDGKTITGTLEPWYGGPTTVFYYNMTVTLTNDSQVVDSAHVLIFKLSASGGKDYNNTMSPAGFSERNTTDANNVTTHTRIFNYTYSSTIATSVNQFLFQAEISGSWMSAGDLSSSGKLFYLQGPIYKNSWDVAKPLLPSIYEYGYIYVFIPYALICGMIWWTRRARRMREQQVEKWQKEQAESDKQKPKEASKVPSLASAMGKSEDSFVCSECGADVPADATVCPKCGEKFD